MKIKLFENLSQLEFENTFYDIHNDFSLNGIEYEGNTLTISFLSDSSKSIFAFCFKDAKIEKIQLFDKPEFIDSIYRGKFEQDNVLIEKNTNNQYYFYIDFVSGLSIELWSKELEFNVSHI